MPTPTYVPLATITLATTEADIVFSSIPAGYRDLILISDAVGSGYLSLQFNSDTGSNYPYNAMFGGGSGSGGAQSGTFVRVGMTYPLSATHENGTIFQLMDYAQTDKHKTILYRGNNAGAGVWAGASQWANTTAINTIRVFCEAGSLTSTTTLSLYGVN